MKDKKIKRNKKSYIIIGVTLGIIVLAIIIGVVVYNDKLDGRECLDCPYKTKLGNGDILILNAYSTKKSTSKSVYYSEYVTIGTASTDLKASGTATVSCDCSLRKYEFKNMKKSYYNQSKNVSYTFKFTDLDDQGISENISVLDISGSKCEGISCDCEVTNVSGTLKIYGERVR